MYNINFYNNYLFLEKLNFLNLKFINYKKINIIYDHNPQNINYNELNKISAWCKKNRVKLYIIDNYKLAVKYRVSGIYLTAKNKAPVFSKYFRNNFGNAMNIWVYPNLFASEKYYFFRDIAG